MRAIRDRFRRRHHVDDDDNGGGRSRVGSGATAARRGLARIIDLITAVVVGIIVLGILLVVLKANPENGIVDALRDAAKWLSKPFDAIFEMDKRRTEIAVNWGIAAVVYLIAGRVIARLVRR
jgi:hypothetical protein